MKRCSPGVGLCLGSSGGGDSVAEVVRVKRHSLLSESVSMASVSILAEMLVERLVEMF